jgi:hypothetical protein
LELVGHLVEAEIPVASFGKITAFGDRDTTALVRDLPDAGPPRTARVSGPQTVREIWWPVIQGKVAIQG